jgi:hypothetical protein
MRDKPMTGSPVLLSIWSLHFRPFFLTSVAVFMPTTGRDSLEKIKASDGGIFARGGFCYRQSIGAMGV